MIFLSDFYKSIFSCKTYKLSVDAGCTCPNRDGTKGWGGCIFCSEQGSGDFVPSRIKSVHQQIQEAKEKVIKKARGRSGKNDCAFIAYFQNFTSTYGNSEQLIEKYKEALNCPDVTGIAVATRPDCLNKTILDYLAELSQTTFVQIELGLQTSNEQTGIFINRCYTDKDYTETVNRIKKASDKIHIVTHLIFGLPGETENQMLESVKFVVDTNKNINSKDGSGSWGIKITSLYIVEKTKLAQIYHTGQYNPVTKEEYFQVLIKALKLLPHECVVHRLTGDPPKSILISPQWPADKKKVLNEIKQLILSQN